MEQAQEDLVASYAKLEEPELMELARTYDSLTDSAQSALRAEFARRGLEPPLIEEVPEPEFRSLITLRRYRDLSEAIVARSLLESAGIAVYLRDENLVRLDWQVSNFIGGIRLQVDAANEQSALEVRPNCRFRCRTLASACLVDADATHPAAFATDSGGPQIQSALDFAVFPPCPARAARPSFGARGQRQRKDIE